METLVDRDRELKYKYGKCRIGRVKRSLGGQNLNLFILGHTILALGDPCFTNLNFFLMLCFVNVLERAIYRDEVDASSLCC